MKAVVYNRYGGPDVLSVREVPVPEPADDELLVRVHAASINSWDWDMIRGRPFFVRMWGLFGPRYKIPGADIAGVVVAVGNQVTRWKEGDEVFGDLCEDGWGGYAEFVCVKEGSLAAKPPSVSFEEAAALPQAGLLALQSFLLKEHLAEGEEVLVNGGGGGVGTFAIQLGRYYKCRVTAIDRDDKRDAMAALGASNTFDYKQYDFTRDRRRYDLIIDMVASCSVKTCRNLLRDGGRYFMVGGTARAILSAMVTSRRSPDKHNRKACLMAYKPNRDLDHLAGLVVDGHIKPVVDQVYGIDDIQAAFHHFATGGVTGKLVIRVVG